MAVRHGEKHHLHRHERLPAGLQVLLSGREECEGADVVGDGQDIYRLCTGPQGGVPRGERGVGLYWRRAVPGD